MRAVTLATCTLNQWAMDFEGNYQRILQTIIAAKAKGAAYRCGPELEVTGYGCADHFYESDTFLHSWEVIAKIMEDKRCSDIIIDVGMPAMHKNVAYNCRVIFLNKKILLIRPKKKLCDNGLYRESRWFTGWMKDCKVESFYLPKVIQNISGQVTVPIGDAIICTSDTSIGFEICEELWNPDSSLIKQSCSGIEIIVNSSGGFHEIGKTKDVINVIKSATAKCGGVYIFSNLRGCDGDVVYYHGTSHITLNGNILAMGEQFSLKEAEVVIATLDLDDVVAYRRGLCKLSGHIVYPQIEVDWYISSPHVHIPTIPNSLFSLKMYDEGEELALGPACWLWDYLRRSESNGILLALDGDIDSCSSAVIVYSMCSLICKAVEDGNLCVLSDLRKIINDFTYTPSNPKELCNLILVTCHLSSVNVNDKKINSNDLSQEIGSNHYNIPVEKIIHSIINILILTCSKLFNVRKEYKNMLIRSSYETRIKMIILYIFSEILSLNKDYFSRILVLGVGNADKALLGNFVKYGNFSGDLSLTGGINEKNLKKFLEYSKLYFKLKSLDKILSCDENCSDALTVEKQEANHELRRLKRENCGVYTTFCKLASKCNNKIEIKNISEKVKHLFYLISFYRHKNYSISPCLHLGSYATVNSYYNQHQILYNTKWTWQYHAIDREVKALEKSSCYN